MDRPAGTQTDRPYENITFPHVKCIRNNSLMNVSLRDFSLSVCALNYSKDVILSEKFPLLLFRQLKQFFKAI